MYILKLKLFIDIFTKHDIYQHTYLGHMYANTISIHSKYTSRVCIFSYKKLHRMHLLISSLETDSHPRAAR